MNNLKLKLIKKNDKNMKKKLKKKKKGDIKIKKFIILCNLMFF